MASNETFLEQIRRIQEISKQPPQEEKLTPQEEPRRIDRAMQRTRDTIVVSPSKESHIGISIGFGNSEAVQLAKSRVRINNIANEDIRKFYQKINIEGFKGFGELKEFLDTESKTYKNSPESFNEKRKKHYNDAIKLYNDHLISEYFYLSLCSAKETFRNKVANCGEYAILCAIHLLCEGIDNIEICVHGNHQFLRIGTCIIDPWVGVIINDDPNYDSYRSVLKHLPSVEFKTICRITFSDPQIQKAIDLFLENEDNPVNINNSLSEERRKTVN